MSSSVKSEGVWILPRDDESSCTFRGHDPSHGNVEAIEVASGGLAIGAPSCELVAGGGPYKWITNYVAGDKVYCVHDEEVAEGPFRDLGKS
ncbi:hypothetical protein ACVINI_005097 [Rhizobium beringeri]